MIREGVGKLKKRNCHPQVVHGRGTDVVSRKINLTVTCMVDGSEEMLESRRADWLTTSIITSCGYYNDKLTRIWQ